MIKNICAALMAMSTLLVTHGVLADGLAPSGQYTLTTNVYGVSDYYYRGLMQAWHKPAIQGGVNFVHTSGWNAGAWGFNVSNNQYSGGSDWFGVNRASGFDSDSRGSSYMEVNVAYEFVPTWTANLHLAKTDIKTILGGRSLNYNDGLIGVGKTFGQGWNTSLSYVKASYQDATAWWKPSGGYGSLANSDTLVNSGQGRLIFSLGRVY